MRWRRRLGPLIPIDSDASETSPSSPDPGEITFRNLIHQLTTNKRRQQSIWATLGRDYNPSSVRRVYFSLLVVLGLCGDSFCVERTFAFALEALVIANPSNGGFFRLLFVESCCLVLALTCIRLHAICQQRKRKLDT